MPRARLGAGSWQFEDEPLARAARQDHRGQEDARRGLWRAALWHQDRPQRRLHHRHGDARPAGDAGHEVGEAAEPFLRGENVKRWRVEPEGLFLINTPKGKVDIDAYPAIRDWLLPFKPELEKRATKQEWFELQQAQLAYQPQISARRKIVYHTLRSQERIFALIDQGFSSTTTPILSPLRTYRCSPYLNSKLAWFFFLSSVTNIARGGYLRCYARQVCWSKHQFRKCQKSLRAISPRKAWRTLY